MIRVENFMRRNTKLNYLCPASHRTVNSNINRLKIIYFFKVCALCCLLISMLMACSSRSTSSHLKDINAVDKHNLDASVLLVSYNYETVAYTNWESGSSSEDMSVVSIPVKMNTKNQLKGVVLKVFSKMFNNVNLIGKTNESSDIQINIDIKNISIKNSKASPDTIHAELKYSLDIYDMHNKSNKLVYHDKLVGNSRVDAKSILSDNPVSMILD